MMRVPPISLSLLVIDFQDTTESRGQWTTGDFHQVTVKRLGGGPAQWHQLPTNSSLSVSAGEAVAPASELADALKQTRELQ